MEPYIIVLVVLGLATLLFISGKLRHDVIAVLALLSLVIAGVVAPAEAFLGFGNQAVVTVAAVLVIGKALEHSGVIDVLAHQIHKIGSNIYLQILSLSLLVAVASAFMNNVGALAILMPVTIQMARKANRPPALYLMPLAFASLLGGMTTLIGTPPNILIAAFRKEQTGVPFQMFDFLPVGGLVALAGVLFISLVGWKFIPRRKSADHEDASFKVEDYITEVMATKQSNLLGASISQLAAKFSEVQVLSIVRQGTRIHAPKAYEQIRTDDILIIETDAEALSAFIQKTKVELVGEEMIASLKDVGDIQLAEAIVMQDSPLVGRTAAGLFMRDAHGVNLLAIARSNKRIHRRLDHAIFAVGDVLLLQGHEKSLPGVIQNLGCLPLAERALRLGYKTRIPVALTIFIFAIALVIFNILPVAVSFVLAALLMVLMRVIPLKDVYHSIDWTVIVLLAAMLPVGGAFEQSGGAKLLAGLVVYTADFLPAWGIITVILVITMLISDVMNNAATVVLMAPVALSVAAALNYSSDAFLMAVSIGGSSAFLTPIGHQSNTLVMAPGGYKFSDYWRLGLPLEVLIVALSVPLIVIFWPI